MCQNIKIFGVSLVYYINSDMHGLDRMDGWMDGWSPGGVKYRAPYGTKISRELCISLSTSASYDAKGAEAELHLCDLAQCEI